MSLNINDTTVNYSSMWNGLYTYSETKEGKNKNSLNNLVRVELDESGTGTMALPKLKIGKKRYKDIIFNIKTLQNSYIYGKNNDETIKIGGIILYTGKDNKIALTLAVNLKDVYEKISGNPRGDKLLNNLSIKISGLSKGQYPDIAHLTCEEEGDCPDMNCASSKYGCCPDGITPKSSKNDKCKKRPKIINCSKTKFGCCPNSNIARKSAKDNCNTGKTKGCAISKYGCCPDSEIPRKSANDDCSGINPIIPSKPNIPDTPSKPNIPGIPSKPNIPGIPSKPNIPGIPSKPNIPIIPGINPIVPLEPSGGKPHPPKKCNDPKGCNKPVPYKPKNKCLHDPKYCTPQDILNIIEGNNIQGNPSKDNYCPPLYPYAYGSDKYGEGPQCCIGKPIYNNSIKQFDCHSPGACHGKGCGGNSQQCKSDKCFSNQIVNSGSVCPANYPYPFTYVIGQNNKNGEKWGGDGFFCCASDPGKNGNCDKGDMSVCPYPQCRPNKAGIEEVEAIKTIICSQEIKNKGQLLQSLSVAYTKENPNGIKLDFIQSIDKNHYKYITYSRSSLQVKNKKGVDSIKTQKIISYPFKVQDITIKKGTSSNGKTNDSIVSGFIEIKLKKGPVINIDQRYQNYIGINTLNPSKSPIINQNLWITLTMNDLTTCISNDKPLYLIPNPTNYLNRDWKNEWSNMGSKSIPNPQFVINNINRSKDGLTQKILSGNPPYDILKDSDNSYYFYDKSSIPIDCSTPEKCRETCSGYNSSNQPYYYKCSDNTSNIFCEADRNYSNNFRTCGSENRGYAVPMPVCPPEYPHPYNKGSSCCSIDQDENMGHLTYNSTTCRAENIDCQQPPCCPATASNIYHKPIQDSNDTERLCYPTGVNPDEDSYRVCSPSGSNSNYISCNEQPTINTTFQSIDKSNHILVSEKNKNKLVDCYNACKKKPGCGMYEYNPTLKTCDLFPTLPNGIIQNVNGKNITGYVYNNPYIMNQTITNSNSIKSTKASSADSCSNECSKNVDCQSFTYDAKNNQCNLYSTTKPSLGGDSNSISGIMPPEVNGIRDLYYLNNPENAILVATQTLEDIEQKNLTQNIEQFQSAINDVKLNTKENFNPGLMSKDIAIGTLKACGNNKKSNTECEEYLANNIIRDGKSLNNINGIYSNQNKSNCPIGYPFALNAGQNCCSTEQYGKNDLLICNEENMIKCNDPPCGDDLIGSYENTIGTNFISTPKIDNSVEEFSNAKSIIKPICYLDKKSSNSKMFYKSKGVKGINTCNVGKQCVGGIIFPNGKGSIDMIKSKPGKCIDSTTPSITYGIKYRTTNIDGTTNIINNNNKNISSPDYCATECANTPDCKTWNWDFNTSSTDSSKNGTCTLLNNVPVMIKGDESISGINQNLVPPNSNQNICETKFNNKQVYAIDNTKLGTNNINDYFNTNGGEKYTILKGQGTKIYFKGENEGSNFPIKIEGKEVEANIEKAFGSNNNTNELTNTLFKGNAWCTNNNNCYNDVNLVLGNPQYYAGLPWKCGERCTGGLAAIECSCACVNDKNYCVIGNNFGSIYQDANISGNDKNFVQNAYNDNIVQKGGKIDSYCNNLCKGQPGQLNYTNGNYTLNTSPCKNNPGFSGNGWCTSASLSCKCDAREDTSICPNYYYKGANQETAMNSAIKACIDSKNKGGGCGGVQRSLCNSSASLNKNLSNANIKSGINNIPLFELTTGQNIQNPLSNTNVSDIYNIYSNNWSEQEEKGYICAYRDNYNT